MIANKVSMNGIYEYNNNVPKTNLSIVFTECLNSQINTFLSRHYRYYVLI